MHCSSEDIGIWFGRNFACSAQLYRVNILIIGMSSTNDARSANISKNNIRSSYGSVHHTKRTSRATTFVLAFFSSPFSRPFSPHVSQRFVTPPNSIQPSIHHVLHIISDHASNRYHMPPRKLPHTPCGPPQGLPYHYCSR